MMETLQPQITTKQFFLTYILNIYSLHYYKVEYTKPKSFGTMEVI
jgi:hypothetical protein